MKINKKLLLQSLYFKTIKRQEAEIQGPSQAWIFSCVVSVSPTALNTV
jgi:hypothetical protein